MLALVPGLDDEETPADVALSTWHLPPASLDRCQAIPDVVVCEALDGQVVQDDLTATLGERSELRPELTMLAGDR